MWLLLGFLVIVCWQFSHNHRFWSTLWEWVGVGMGIVDLMDKLWVRVASDWWVGVYLSLLFWRIVISGYVNFLCGDFWVGWGWRVDLVLRTRWGVCYDLHYCM